MNRITFCLGALVAGLLLCGSTTSRGQVNVDISLKRSLYVVYEPLICTVTITNRTGRTLELADTPKNKWFSFQIETVDGRPLPPINADYQNAPISVPPGEKLVRAINITPLYPLTEFGTYRIQAAVFVPEFNKYFASPRLNVEITEGRLLWQQTVGVPQGAGAGNSRTVSILAHRLPQTSMLYLRVEDRDQGIVYCTTQLGRFVAFANPDVQLDANNEIHILQNTAPKTFLYSHFDINGKILGQQAYQMDKDRPLLVRGTNDTISVKNGVPYDPKAPPPERALPKLSDRPVPLPTPATKPTPEDKRPEHLLSN